MNLFHQATTTLKPTGGPRSVVALGCPGGRVRVIRPGGWRTDVSNLHQLGIFNAGDSTGDLGSGGCALAIRPEGTGGGQFLRIWFGTLQHPDLRPQNYTSDAGTLADPEVSAGAVHVMTWAPGTGFSTAGTPAPTLMHPTASEPRGASGVVGMLLADLLAASPGDELIVGTLSGEVIVYTANTMAELWRDRVPGAAGCYNSILAEDLDGDGLKELYVAGSLGLWRFVQPGE
jgi:hypothetical protein